MIRFPEYFTSPATTRKSLGKLILIASAALMVLWIWKTKVAEPTELMVLEFMENARLEMVPAVIPEITTF